MAAICVTENKEYVDFVYEAIITMYFRLIKFSYNQ